MASAATKFAISLLLIAFISSFTRIIRTDAFLPFTGNSPWDALMFPADDPFRILEQTPFPFPKAAEGLALARADWKETATEHVISIDVPGMKQEDIKIEVEENRVLRVSGERKADDQIEGEKWHRVERSSTGKFWRQFRLPISADMERVNARLENGVLRITVPKLPEEKKRQPRIINIVESDKSGQDIKPTTKADA